jgi:hypothetical protein
MDNLQHKSIEFLTADTPAGREAINSVMRLSYTTDIDDSHPDWALALIVDGVPTSFALIDPTRQMSFPGRSIPYGYIAHVATRKDRRSEGNFQIIMNESFRRLKESGCTLAVVHGPYRLYYQFGFTPFTYHSGIFIKPEQISRVLGTKVPPHAESLFHVEQSSLIRRDLLVISNLRVREYHEASAILIGAAEYARRFNKSEILFEHPNAHGYGSTYPIYNSPETRFTKLARALGGRVIVKGTDPVSDEIPEADYLKPLDIPGFLHQCATGRLARSNPLQNGQIAFHTENGDATIESDGNAVRIYAGCKKDATIVNAPTAALAQLVTGYLPVNLMCAVYNIPLSEPAKALLSSLFPPIWRFSRNKSWMYQTDPSSGINWFGY